MKNNTKFEVPKNGRLESRANSKTAKDHAKLTKFLKRCLTMALQDPRTCIGAMKSQKERPESSHRLQDFGTVRPVPHGTKGVPHDTDSVPHGTVGQIPAET
jgi:hypothetical protein